MSTDLFKKVVDLSSTGISEIAKVGLGWGGMTVGD